MNFWPLQGIWLHQDEPRYLDNTAKYKEHIQTVRSLVEKLFFYVGINHKIIKLFYVFLFDEVLELLVLILI